MSSKRRKNRLRHPCGKLARTGEKGRHNRDLDEADLRNSRKAEPGVYFIEAGDMGIVKVGHTRDRIHRISQLACGNPMWLRFVGWTPCVSIDHAREIEFTIHRVLKAAGRRHIRGEWYRLTDADLRWLIDFSKSRSLELAIEAAA